MELAWWHWAVGGIVLIVAELVVPSFVLIWFGLGALAVEVGMLVRDVAPFEKGEVRFQKPILGADVWECIADEAIRSGERVRVLEVEGSFLKIGRAGG